MWEENSEKGKGGERQTKMSKSELLRKKGRMTMRKLQKQTAGMLKGENVITDYDLAQWKNSFINTFHSTEEVIFRP